MRADTRKSLPPVLWLLPLILWLGATAARAQEEQTATIRVETDLVSVDVRLSDPSGRRQIGGLLAEDFAVYEDGVRQKITNFSAADMPYNLVLLIDTSGSTREELSLIRRAARKFFDELRPQDRLALIQFNKEVELLQDLTADRDKLEKALGLLKPGTGTSFYDALQLTIEEVFRKVEGRKAIVTLTDGVDSYGYLTFEKILPALEQAGATAYFLELDTEQFTAAGMMRSCNSPDHFEFSAKQLRKYYEEYVRSGPVSYYSSHCRLGEMERMQINRRLYESARREIRKISEQTGGQVFPVKQLQQLDAAYTQIADELRTVYSLAYYPTNDKHDGRWRKLRVDVRRPGLTARTRPGYRARNNR